MKAQSNKIDSLKLLLKTAQHDTTRFNTLMTIGNFYQNINPDTAIYYHAQARNLNQKLNNPLKIGEALKAEGWDNFVKGNNDDALKLYNEALQIAEKAIKQNSNKSYVSASKKLKAACLGNNGILFHQRGNTVKALEYYFAALKINEEILNKRGQATILGNIGLVYKSHGEGLKALNYFLRALKLCEEINYKQGQISSYTNIGIIYSDQNDFSKALEYQFKALKINEETGNKQGEAANLGSIGVIYNRQAHFKKALNYFLKALKINEETGNKGFEVVLLGNIGSIYITFKKYLVAEKYIKQSYAIACEIGSLEEIKKAHQNLSYIYQENNQSALALKQYKLYVQYNDSLLNKENTKASIQQEMKFNYEKKAAADSVKVSEEKKIEQIKLSVSEAMLKQEKTQRYALYGGLGIIIIFAGFMVNRFRVTNRQKKLISEQKKIVEEQKNEVEEKQKEILDSIHYAKRIQTALLTNEKYIERVINKLQKK